MSATITQTMTQDHKHCDELFTQLDSLITDEQWDQAHTQFSSVADNILFHFNYEEQTLFTEFETTTNNLSGPTMIMRQEHEQIRDLLNELKKTIDSKNYERYLGLSETINIFIQQHNIKEENILYPMIDDACALVKDQLLENMLRHMSNKVA